MREILVWDIENIYIGLGNKLIKQTLGIPKANKNNTGTMQDRTPVEKLCDTFGVSTGNDARLVFRD